LKRHPAVARAEVFGSFARGEQTPQSDIDIILAKKGNSILGFEFFAIADEIESATGRRVDLITPDTARELVYGDRILREAKCIYES
jgi:uncharacterized protein